MLDLVIRNGKIVDGSGSPWFRGDIGIEGNLITDVGRVEGQAKREIDADGRVVSPGFIDIHTHSDIPLVIDPRAESKIRQGVTTEVVGNCGSSAAPLLGEAVDRMKQRLSTYDPPFELDWATMDEYLGKLETQGIGVNCLTLVGHGTIRTSVMGIRDAPPTEQEMEEMKRLLRESILAGAIGMSTGLIYPPSCYAKTDEIIELAKTASELGGLYFSHVRGGDAQEVTGVREAIKIAREADIPCQVAHLHGIYENALLIEEARRDGVDITYDQYPYTAGSGPLKTLIPEWAHEGGNDVLAPRLRNPEDRARIRREMGDIKKAPDWSKIFISSVTTEANRKYEGKSVAQISEVVGKDGYDVVFDLLVEEGGEGSMVIFGQSEEGVRKVMGHPIYMVGSDGSSLNRTGPLSRGKPHPRNYGTFPRILGRYVREEKIVTLENAVRQITSAPANRLRLTRRGLIRPGMYADIVVFDETSVIDIATYEDPHRYPVGIDYVIVNGQVAVDGGERTDVLSGSVLRVKQSCS